MDLATEDFGPPPRTGLEPNGNVVVDSYRQDIIKGFQQDGPAYNSMNPERPQSSIMVDLKDPIQIHLLTETALSDSKEFEILSQEEIDGLKKLVQTLTKRIESTRSNLLIQSKYRDAANSMAKLYAPSTSSSSADAADHEHSLREAEEERRVTQQRCEDLAAELFYLEKRLMEPKGRLLEHTAGILQLTHKASKKKAAANEQAPNGVPGSPESLYTYTQGRDSLYGPDGFYTDETSFDDLDHGATRALATNPLEIPMKSPIREQQSQLKEELDRAREENTYLMASISEMERRLEDLNNSLRDTIIRFNPEHNAEFNPPPKSATPDGADPSEFLRGQFDYLETALEAIEAEQQTLLDELHGNESVGNDNTDAALTELWDMIHKGYTNIRKTQEDRRRARADKGLEDDEDISDDEGIDLSESYTLAGFSSRVRWLYRQATVLKDQKSVLKRQIKQQRELNNKSDAEKDAELAQKQEELDRSHIIISRAEKDAMDAQQMLADAVDELEQARGAGAMHAELQERAARTEALEAKLKELQESLAASEADSEATQRRLVQVDSSITALSEALDEATDAAAQAHAKSEHLQQELRQKQEEVARAQEEVRQAQEDAQQAEEEIEQAHEEAQRAQEAARQAEEQARQAQQEARKAKEEAQQAQEEMQQAQEEIEQVYAEAKQAQQEADQAQQEAKAAQELAKKKESEVRDKEKALKSKEEDYDLLNMSYVELKTEVTIARAELDGAYGTRAERAADMAAIKTNGEVGKLEGQVQKLKSELAETVKELEEVTKETINSEREKTELEGRLDEAMSVRMALEADMSSLREKLDAEVQKSTDKLSRLQEELDSEKLKASRGDASARPGAGASVLSEKFRATMREERKKFQEDIKEERTRNRKLEEELSRLKRAQGPGKSPLSPR